MAGDLLDKLHERWLRAKDLGPQAPDQVMWPAFDHGGLVGWHEVHPGDRRDSYLHDDAIFIAEVGEPPNIRIGRRVQVLRRCVTQAIRMIQVSDRR